MDTIYKGFMLQRKTVISVSNVRVLEGDECFLVQYAEAIRDCQKNGNAVIDFATNANGACFGCYIHNVNEEFANKINKKYFINFSISPFSMSANYFDSQYEEGKTWLISEDA
jgi:hypothetical protein